MRAQAMSYGRDSQGFIDCLERGMHDMREMLKVDTGDACGCGEGAPQPEGTPCGSPPWMRGSTCAVPVRWWLVLRCTQGPVCEAERHIPCCQRLASCTYFIY